MFVCEKRDKGFGLLLGRNGTRRILFVQDMAQVVSLNFIWYKYETKKLDERNGGGTEKAEHHQEQSAKVLKGKIENSVGAIQNLSFHSTYPHL